MDYFFTQNDIDEIGFCTERIQRIIGKAIGREEAIKARRDEFAILDFSAELAKKKQRHYIRGKRIFEKTQKGIFKNAGDIPKKTAAHPSEQTQKPQRLL